MSIANVDEVGGKHGSQAPARTHPAAPGAMPRRDFLKLSGGATTALLATQFLGVATPTATAAPLPNRKNLILILTDQERAVMWFPPDWEAANLPTLTRLKSNGLTFSRAFTCSAMCSPARNTLLTGLFPAQHRAPDTLTEGFQQSPVERQLDPALPNLATCLSEAGYDVVYKGKWHLSKAVQSATGSVIEDDITRYGFHGWDAPDAGGDTAIAGFGGGTANHDARFIDDAVAFLQDRLLHPSTRPFCLVVSLVNPHDLLGYPRSYSAGGYSDDPWLNPTTPAIPLPPTVDEDLRRAKKPTAHLQILNSLAAGLGTLLTPAAQTNYLNFYGNLMRKVDGQIGKLLAVFDNGGAAGLQLLSDTLIIRTADHGENGLCHGGLRQKTFVCYEETLRVPLVWSNPQLYPSAQTTSALISHVDILPTLCALTGVPNWASKGFKGVDHSSIVLNPAAPPLQDYVLFTFDDIYAGTDQALSPSGLVDPPNRIQMIRTTDFKYARYTDGAGVAAEQGEFYDLRPSGGDYDATYGLPLELRNLSTWAVASFPNPPTLTAAQTSARTQLARDLAAAATSRLQPRSANAPVAPENLDLAVVRYSDAGGAHTRVQLTFLSRADETYQVQSSTDLLTWSDLEAPIMGNNGPILRHYELVEPKAFYRLQWAAAR